MSDSVKPENKPVVFEPSSADSEILPTTPAPATATEEVTPADAEKSAEESTTEEKKEEKPEPKEITHGTLSKAHGGLLAFFRQKRFFYFQDEPVSEDKLKIYLNKDTASRATAAYASQTGKGLLLYSKDEGQKEVPHGIIKLADVTDVVASGVNKFILKLASGELHFESPAAERDSWVFTLNHKIAEAKATVNEITTSEGYTTAYEKLTKPTVATPKAPEKITESREESENTEAKLEQTDVASPSDANEEDVAVADKKAEVKRSLSKKNKRTSVFSFLGDKKKKPEEKKEAPTEKKDEEVAKDEVKPSEAEIAPVGAEASTAAPTEVKETTESDEIEKTAETGTAPKPTKRNSIFGAFSREKKEKEIEEEKKEEIKSETIETPEAVITETKPTEAAPDATPASSPPKPKFLSSFFDKKEKGPAIKTPEKETEVKALEATGPTIAVPAETIETIPVVDDSAVADSATPATSPKEQKRKSSFFSSFKKEKKVEDVKSDSEDAEPAQKSGTTSPTPKSGLLTGLIRKASRSTKNPGKEADSKEVAAPETVAEESASATATSDNVPTEAVTTPITDIPEVVPVSQAPVQSTVPV